MRRSLPKFYPAKSLFSRFSAISTSPWSETQSPAKISLMAFMILRTHSSTNSSLHSVHYDDRGPFSDKILRLTDEIASLSDEELVQMSAGLRKKLGIPEPSDMTMAPGASGMEDMASPPVESEEKPPEKTLFDLKLQKFDASQKIKVIKEVRAITNVGLKEAKDLVEKIPAVLKTGVSKEEALQIVEKIKAVGGEVAME